MKSQRSLGTIQYTSHQFTYFMRLNAVEMKFHQLSPVQKVADNCYVA